MNMWRQNSRAGARRSGSGFRLQAGACAAVALLMSAVAPPSLSIAAELPYNESGITGYFDTTVSIGTAIRTQGRDKAIIAIANGGYAPSFNEDDGNLNYNKGDFVSANVKISHELQLDVRNLSFFGRAFYFYDHAAAANDTRRTSLSGKAQQYAGHDIQLMDAYVSTDFDVSEFPISIRIGNQVLNWGESVFIRNGLNSINPIDVSKARIAGAEVRDVVTPIPAVNLKVGLTDNLSLEGFYQFRWLHTRLEPAGTFFSTTDAASPGGDIIHFGFGDPARGNDNDYAPDPSCPGLCSRLPRVSDRDARHQGQFGLAVRYFAPALNDAELGLYYARIHSRLPLVSARAGNPQALTDPKGFAGSVQYFREFPEDIDIMGASFNTEIGTSGFAIQGEVSYRRNQPLQIDAVEVIFSTLSPLRFVQVPQTLLPLLQNPAACAQNLAVCKQAQGLAQLRGAGGLFSQSQTGPLAPGEEVAGFRRKDVLQAQVAISKVLGPRFGADQSLFLAETGFTYVRDMEDKSVLRYDGPATWTSGNPIFTQAQIQPVTQNGGFADPFSWGYRIVARTTYNNALGSVNLSPQISFSHDVNGTTPSPISNFVEDRKTITLSIGASYLLSWQAILSYTNSFDGGAFNLLNDRDFVSSTANYSF